ncbi:MAG: formylglycine-generating enzyme family protein [Candidatus Eisenbacteria bacterium]
MNSIRMGARTALAALILCFAAVPTSAVTTSSRASGEVPGPEMVRIEGGRYRPLYRQPVRGARPDSLVRRVMSVRVKPFSIDRRPVTNAAYLEFVREHPKWRRSHVSRLFADESYLRHWRGDLDLGPNAPPTSPLVNVSWFAARAYCESRGKRLPMVAEWELVGAADETHRNATHDPVFLERLRNWYALPTPAILPAVGQGFRNLWGVEDMHGLVWEWTLDFNSALVSGESRGDASLEKSLFCGGGASSAADFSDYAAFMRFAYRGSLEARYATSALGFRGVRELPNGQRRSP